MTTLAFDVYGTLIDTAGVTGALEKLMDDADAAATDAAKFSDEWRRKQLEYSFRYGLMGQYRGFRVCTRQALDHCCAQMQADFSPQARDDLMAQYLALPVFDDVAAGLARLSKAGVKMYAFSNGMPDDLEKLLGHAGVRDYFAGVVSVDEVSTFKPNPAVYRHFLKRARATARESWLISSNGFDICGARAMGMRAVWLRRNPAVVFDPWEFTPDRQVATFAEVAALFTGHNGAPD